MMLYLGVFAVLFALLSAGLVFSDAHAQTVTHAIAETGSLDLPTGGYRHNLVHLTGEYYVSLHISTSQANNQNFWIYAPIVTLYRITDDGDITRIGARTVDGIAQNKATTIDEFTTLPKSVAITRVDDDTIVVSFTTTSVSRVRTYDVNTGIAAPFFIIDNLSILGGGNSAETHNHSLISLDANRLVLAYSHPDSSPSGFIQVIDVSNTGQLTTGTPTRITTDLGRYPSVAKLDGDTVVVAYSTSAGGFVQAFDISGSSVITPGTASAYEDARTAYHSLVRVDGDTMALAFSNIGLATSTSDGAARIVVFDVSSTGTITGKSNTTYYNSAANAAFEAQAHTNSLTLMDSNTLAVAYRGAEGDGFIRLYDINHSTGALTASGGPLEHDTADGAFNALVRIDDETFALLYGGDLPSQVQNTDTPNTIKTFIIDPTPPIITSIETINANTILLTAPEPLVGTTSGFAISGNTISGSPVISGSTITLTVGTEIVSGDIIRLSYIGTNISDIAGNALATFGSRLVTNNVEPISFAIAQVHSVDLPNNGYRHNLVHLTGNYYVSSHTVSSSADTTNFGFATVLRLYSITDGIIAMIGAEQIVNTLTQAKTTTIGELTTNPRSTAIARVDANTIAVSYVSSTRASTIATYDVVTGSATPFSNSGTHDFIITTNNSGGQTHNHSLIALDADTLVIGYQFSNTNSRGFVQTISVDSTTGDLDNSDSFTVGTSASDVLGRYLTLAKLDADTVVLAYRGGPSDSGFIQALDIPADNTIISGTAAEHEGLRTSYNSLIRVDDDTVAVAYSRIDLDTSTSDGHGRIKIFDVASDGTITGRGGPVYYDAVADVAIEEHAHLNSMVMMDSDTIAIAYRGAEGDGFIRLYDINLSTNGLTAISQPFEQDTADGAFNSLVRVDDETVALVYGGDLPSTILDSTATPNTIKTVAAGVQPVINNVNAVRGSYNVDGMINIRVEFDKPVTVSGIPQLTLDIGATNTVVDYTSKGSTNSLIFQYTVAATHNSADLNYVNTGSLSLNGGTILATDNKLPADLTLPAITSISSLGGSNVIVDTVIPSVESITATTSDGGTQNTATISYTATFSEDVIDFVMSDITVTGTASGGTPVVSNILGTGNSYTFDVVTDSDGIVIMTIPAGVTADAAGNLNTASTAYTVTVDTVAPLFPSAATTDTTTIVLTTNEPLVAGTAPAGDFAVSDNTITEDPVISDTTITITVNTAIEGNSAVTVTYTGTTVTDVAGNSLVKFIGLLVTNNVADTTGPTFDFAQTTTATTIVITVSEPIEGATTAVDYTVSGHTIFGDPVIDGNTITLRIGTAIVSGDTPTVDYTGTGLADATGNLLATFDSQSVTNNVGNPLSQIDSVDLPDNGYRHNLVHLTGNYYVSSHTVSSIADTTNFDFDTIIRLYSIIDGQITLIGSELVNTITQAKTTTIDELTTNPRSTAVARVDDNTIAVSYVKDAAESIITTYDVDTGSATPFDNPNSFNFTLGSTNGGETHNHSLIALDANRLVITFSLGDSILTGSIGVIDIDPTSGDLTSPGSNAIGSTINDILIRYTSLVKLDDDTVVVAYRNTASGNGFMRTFDIASNSNIEGRADVEHDNRRIAYNSIIRVDDDTVAVAYSAIGASTLRDDGHGTIKVFDVDSDGTINGMGSQTYQNTAAVAAFEEQIHLNSMTLLDSDTIAVAYRGDDGDGFIRLYDINLSSGALTVNGDPFEHDTADGAFNSLLRVDDTTLALVYGGDLFTQIQDATATPNRIKTVTTAQDTTLPTIASAAITDATTIVLTASEPVVGTTVIADYTIPGYTVTANPVISGNTITITVDAAIAVGSTVTVDYEGALIIDAAGNALAMFTDQSVITEGAVVTGVSATGGPYIEGGIIDITVTFDESVTVSTVSGTPRLTLETGTNDAVVDYTSGSPGTQLLFRYTVAAGHNSDNLNYVGTGSLDRNGGTILGVENRPARLALPATDSAESLGGSPAVIVDTTAPTVTITNAETDNDGDSSTSGTLTYTATFSETVTDFDATTDITVSGGTVTTGPTGSGTTYTFVVTASGDGTVVVSIPAGAAADTAGNPNTVSGDYTVTVDTTPPTIDTLNTDAAADNGATNSLTLTYTVIFTETVTGFDTANDITVSGGTVTTGPTGSGTTYTFVVTASDGDTVVVSIPAGAAADAAENPNTVSGDYTVTVDTTPPTIVTLNTDAAADNGATNSLTLTYTVTFDETVTGFGTANDITVSGGTVTTGPTGSGTTYTFVVTASDGDTVVVSIPAGAAADAAENPNTVSGDYTVTVDTTPPTIDTLTTTAADDNGATNSLTLTYTVTFDETVTDFDTANDITVSGGTVTTGPTGSGTTYTFVVTASDGDTVVVSIPAGAAADAAENPNTVSGDYTVTVDTTAPMLDTVQTADDTTIVVTTSESLIGNTVIADYTIPGYTVTDVPVISGNTITITVGTTITVGSTVTLDYEGTGITDAAGNALAMFTGRTVITEGAVVTGVSAMDGTYIEGGIIDITVTFDESVTVSTVSGTPRLTLETGTNDAVVDYTSGSPGTQLLFRYTVAAGHNSDDLNYVSTGSLDPNGGTIRDAEGRNARVILPAITDTNSLGVSSAVIVDAAMPTVAINNADSTDGGTVNTATVSYTATFNEDVTGFDVADLTVTGTASDGAPVASNLVGSGASYTFDVATTSDGTVIVSIPENVAADLVGNQNTASNTYTVMVDAEIPEIISARLSTDIITIIYNVPVTTAIADYTLTLSDSSTSPTITEIARSTPPDTISLTLSPAVPAGITVTINVFGPTKTSAPSLVLPQVDAYPVTAEVDITLADTDNRIAVTDSDSTLATVTYPNTVDAILDYSFLLEDEAVLPTATTNNEVVITATGIRGGNIQVTIPAFTSFSSDADFDGILILPTDSGSGCDSTAITSGTQASCIEIGQAGSVINTDKPIRIQLGGQAGNVPWYSEGGAVATQIIAACTADDLDTVSAQLDGTGECFINTDLDLIIWTTHFTVFGSNLVTPPPVVVVEPEPTPEPAPRRSGGGGHGNTLDPRVCGGVLCSEQGSNNKSSGTPSTSRSSSDQTSIVPRVTPEQTQEPDRTQSDADSMLDVPEPEPTSPPTDSESGAMMDPEPTPPPMDPEPTPPSMDPEPTPPSMDPEPTPPSMDPEPTPPSMDPEPTPPSMDPEPGATVAPERNEGILEQIGRWFQSLFG